MSQVNSLLNRMPNPPSTSHLGWQQELASAFRHPQQLLDYLQIDNNAVNQWADANKAVQSFSFLVTRSFAERMQKGNPNDPLLLQVMPTNRESAVVDGFGQDPVGDLQALTVPGLLHKYHGRVLLISTGACPIHCRYCFRRNFPYQANQNNTRQEQQAINYIQQRTEINEVILSGGDPLILTNRRLTQLIDKLETIPHLKRLRLHSRVPTTLPSRIDDGLIQRLTQTRLQTILVTHINHANELNSNVVIQSLDRLALAKVKLFNQSVLLNKINDSVKSLADLSERLFDTGVQPYYLHLLDKVSGASHFEVPENTALYIHQNLQKRLPGYLVPKLVREIPGEMSKISVPTLHI